MPAPLPARLAAPPTADRLMPLPTVIVVEPVPGGRVRPIRGLPTPQAGSLQYGFVFTFGWTTTGGWLTLNRARKGLRCTHRGSEDSNGLHTS